MKTRNQIIIGVIFLAYNILAALFTNGWSWITGTIMFFTEVAVIIGITIYAIINMAKKKKK